MNASRLPTIKVSVKSRVEWDGSYTDQMFLDRIRPRLSRPHSILLLSGGDHDCSNHSIFASSPVAILTAKGKHVSGREPGQAGSWYGDPLEAFDRFQQRFEPDFALEVPPFCGGAVGYLAYELKNTIERLPQTAKDDLGLPDLYLFYPSEIVIHNRRSGKVTHTELGFCGSDGRDLGLLQTTPLMKSAPSATSGPLASNFTRHRYLRAVEAVRHYIREGDIYQVNLSQRFSFPLRGDPLQLFLRFHHRNPAPFYAFIRAADHAILSTSMERFLYRRGDTIETRPIKGTRMRGATPAEDRRLREELASSRKDDAELSMIVDLLRNDLGRICRPRTVRVREHKRIEAYENVYHLVSIVTGTLVDAASYGQIIGTTFPGGSITGCPKIRAMEIIDELEPQVRHVYTGAIGYFGWHDNMDLNIAIRTGIHARNQCHFAVGGGVVYDSDPVDEYEETLHKGRTLFELIRSPL